MQPLHAVDGDVVLFFMAASLHFHAHHVAGVDARGGCVRIAAVDLARVDVRRKARAEHAAARAGHRVQARQRAVAARLQREGHVAAAAVGLHARLAVGADLARVVDAQRQRLLPVVDDQGADVFHRDRLRAGPRRAVVVGHAGGVAQLDVEVGEDVVLQLRARRRMDGELEGARRAAVPLRVAQVLHLRRQARGLRIEGHALLVGADVDAGFVGMLEVAVLEVELAKRDLAVDAGLLRGRRARLRLEGVARIGAGLRLRLDLRLPARGPAVAEDAAVGARVGARRRAGLWVVAEQLAAFVVRPARARGLGQHGGVKADLLVRRRAVVIVRERDAQAAVDAFGVDHRVGEPALRGRARALPLLGELAAELRGHLAPVGMLARHRADAAAVAHVAAVDADAGVELANRMNARLDRGRAERAVFVVPAVGRAVGGGQVPLRQVDVLADDVGGRAHLVVVDLVVLGHQVAVVVDGAVERVQAHHHRLGRLGLGDRVAHVLPQREDALLRVVVADLVEDHVELHVGALVDARRLGVEQAGAARVERGLRPAGQFTGKETPHGAGFEHGARIVHARVVIRRADDRLGAVQDEAAHRAAHGIGGARGLRAVGPEAGHAALRVELHRHLLEVGAFFRVVDDVGLDEVLGEVQARGHDLGLAAGRVALQRVTRQTAVEAVGLRRHDLRPQRVARVLQRCRLGLREHVELRRRRALADDVFHARDPERVAGVDGAVDHLRQRPHRLGRVGQRHLRIRPWSSRGQASPASACRAAAPARGSACRRRFRCRGRRANRPWACPARGPTARCGSRWPRRSLARRAWPAWR